MKISGRETFYLAALAALSAFAAWLRLRGLGISCLWLDEVLTATIASHGPAGIFRLALLETGPLPVSYLLPWLFDHEGRNEFLIRLPDAIAGILSVPLAASAARRLAGDSPFAMLAGLAAAAILAVSETHLYYSREVRGYAVLALFALLSFRLLIEGLETGKKRWWAGLALSSLAGHYTSYFFCFSQAALGIWGAGWLGFAAERKEAPRAELRRRAIGLAAALGLSTALFAPWYVAAMPVLRQYAVDHAPTDASRQVGKWLGEIAASWLPGPWGWRIVAAGLIALGDATMLRARKGLLTLTVAAPLGIASAYFSISTAGHYLTPRYAIGALPACTVAAGLGLAGLIALAKERSAAIRAAAALAATSLFCLYTFAQLRGYFRWALLQKEDWRTAIAAIQKEFRPGDRIVPGVDETILCLQQYLPPELLGSLAPEEAGEPRNMPETARNAAAQEKRVWYVAPNFALSETPGLHRWLDRFFQKVAAVPGDQSTIYLYRGPTTQPPER